MFYVNINIAAAWNDFLANLIAGLRNKKERRMETKSATGTLILTRHVTALERWEIVDRKKLVEMGGTS